MSDRLTELLRQRTLIQEHLAWLDREIATHPDSASATPHLAPAPTSTPQTQPRPSPSPTAAAPQSPRAILPSQGVAAPPPDADSILDQYRSSPDSLHRDVRKGCFLYFAAAFVLLGLGVIALYFLIRPR